MPDHSFTPGRPPSHKAVLDVEIQFLHEQFAETYPVSRVLGAAYCWDTRGIVLGLWSAKGGESGMIGGEGG